MFPGDPGDIVVQMWVHERFGWVMLPLRVGGAVTLDMVLNTGLLTSSISGRAREDLIMKELIPPVSGGYVLTELTLAGHPIADLRVRVQPRVGQLEVDGILGLDFLRQFTDVHFNVPSFRLTLARR